jgi:hypothetical protein
MPFGALRLLPFRAEWQDTRLFIYILISRVSRLATLARDIRLLRVVVARGKAEGADHERSSEPARNGVEWWSQEDSNLRPLQCQCSALTN